MLTILPTKNNSNNKAFISSGELLFYTCAPVAKITCTILIGWQAYRGDQILISISQLLKRKGKSGLPLPTQSKFLVFCKYCKE